MTSVFRLQHPTCKAKDGMLLGPWFLFCELDLKSVSSWEEKLSLSRCREVMSNLTENLNWMQNHPGASDFQLGHFKLHHYFACPSIEVMKSWFCSSVDVQEALFDAGFTVVELELNSDPICSKSGKQVLFTWDQVVSQKDLGFLVLLD